MERLRASKKSLGRGRLSNLSRGRYAAILGTILLVIASGAEAAEDYPIRSITVVVPFPAGGPSDVVARIVTDHMAKTLRQSLAPRTVPAQAAESEILRL